MKTRWMLPLAALAGCASLRGGGQDGWTSQGWATLESYRCAERMVGELGYSVLSRDPVGESLRASRTFDYGDREVDRYTRGYLTVMVDRGRGSELLRVRAERFVESRRAVPGAPRPPDTTPRPPRPTPTPFDTTTGRRPASPGTESRRVEPGPVAVDADRLLRRCTTGTATTAADR